MPQDARRLFASNLAKLLKERGKAARLSKGSGLSAPTISGWTGSEGHGALLENIGPAADSLGVHVAELFLPDGYVLRPEVAPRSGTVTQDVTDVREVHGQHGAAPVDPRVVELQKKNRELAEQVRRAEEIIDGIAGVVSDHRARREKARGTP